jgi:anti-sigma regulatory factor (Ser/Thr protein kinase)
MTHLELAALPTAVPSARKHARAVALEWGLRTLADDVELVVSELVTNAIATTHNTPQGLTAGSPVVRLWLASDLDAILVRVWDASPEMPLRRSPSPDDERGRGLMLVEHLSRDSGAHRIEKGKMVWAIA